MREAQNHKNEETRKAKENYNKILEKGKLKLARKQKEFESKIKTERNALEKSKKEFKKKLDGYKKECYDKLVQDSELIIDQHAKAKAQEILNKMGIKYE